MATRQEIIHAIKSRIEISEGSYRNWYIGNITCTSYKFLTEHGILITGPLAISFRANSGQEALEIVNYFIMLGCHRAIEANDPDGELVYGYMKKDHLMFR